MPRQRILLALRQAIAERDEVRIVGLVEAGRREAPGWDATAELNRLRALRRWRRWRRRPAFVGFLVRVAHLGRVRGG